jgi:thiamine kinase-like enzyme
MLAGVLEKIAHHFDLNCIDKRRQGIFQDVGDLVLNPNTLEPSFIEHLKKQWARNNEDLLKKCLSTHFGSDAFLLKSAPHLSQQCMAYLVCHDKKEYIVKTNAYLGLPDAIFINHFIMKEIIGHNKAIPVPDSQLLFLEDGAPIQIMEKASGEVLRQYIQNVTIVEQRHLIMKSLAKKLFMIHKVTGENFGPVSVNVLVNKRQLVGLHNTCYSYILLNLERHLSYCTSLFRINTKIAKEILLLFETHQCLFKTERSVLLHGDFVKNNLLMHDMELACILDWEDSILGDPLYELAYLSLAYLTQDFDVLFQSYYDERGASLDETERMKLYLYRLRLYISKIAFNDSFQQKPNSSFPKMNKLLFLYEQTRDYLSKR